MSRRTPVKELLQGAGAAASSPLRRSTRLSTTAPAPSTPARATTRRSSTDTGTSTPVPKVTKTRRASYSQDTDADKEKNEPKPTPRGRKGSVSKNPENGDDKEAVAETPSKSRSRASSVSKDDPSVEPKTPARRRRSTSVDVPLDEQRVTRSRSNSIHKSTEESGVSLSQVSNPPSSLEPVIEIEDEAESTKIDEKNPKVKKTDLNLSVIKEASLVEDDDNHSVESFRLSLEDSACILVDKNTENTSPISITSDKENSMPVISQPKRISNVFKEKGRVPSDPIEPMDVDDCVIEDGADADSSQRHKSVSPVYGSPPKLEPETKWTPQSLKIDRRPALPRLGLSLKKEVKRSLPENSATNLRKTTVEVEVKRTKASNTGISQDITDLSIEGTPPELFEDASMPEVMETCGSPKRKIDDVTMVDVQESPKKVKSTESTPVKHSPPATLPEVRILIEVQKTVKIEKLPEVELTDSEELGPSFKRSPHLSEDLEASPSIRRSPRLSQRSITNGDSKSENENEDSKDEVIPEASPKIRSSPRLSQSSGKGSPNLNLKQKALNFDGDEKARKSPTKENLEASTSEELSPGSKRTSLRSSCKGSCNSDSPNHKCQHDVIPEKVESPKLSQKSTEELKIVNKSLIDEENTEKDSDDFGCKSPEVSIVEEKADYESPIKKASSHLPAKFSLEDEDEDEDVVVESDSKVSPKKRTSYRISAKFDEENASVENVSSEKTEEGPKKEENREENLGNSKSKIIPDGDVSPKKRVSLRTIATPEKVSTSKSGEEKVGENGDLDKSLRRSGRKFIQIETSDDKIVENVDLEKSKLKSGRKSLIIEESQDLDKSKRRSGRKSLQIEDVAGNEDLDESKRSGRKSIQTEGNDVKTEESEDSDKSKSRSARKSQIEEKITKKEEVGDVTSSEVETRGLKRKMTSSSSSEYEYSNDDDVEENVKNTSKTSDGNAEDLDSSLQLKIKSLIAQSLQEKEDEETSESESSEVARDFLTMEVEEGEEDTPSEDSNEIIDDGESIGFDDSEHSIQSEESEDDSFIDDDEEEKLLPGDEFDLEISPKRKSRIRNLEDHDSDEDVVNIVSVKKKKVSPIKKERLRIIEQIDSSEDEVDVETVEEEPKEDVEEKPAEENEESEEPKEEVKEEIMDTSQKKKRSSSIVILENIRIDNLEEPIVSDRISKVVEMFCSNIKTKGEVSVNVSFDYEQKSSDENAEIEEETKVVKPEIKSSGLDQTLSDDVFAEPIAKKKKKSNKGSNESQSSQLEIYLSESDKKVEDSKSEESEAALNKKKKRKHRRRKQKQPTEETVQVSETDKIESKKPAKTSKSNWKETVETVEDSESEEEFEPKETAKTSKSNRKSFELPKESSLNPASHLIKKKKKKQLIKPENILLQRETIGVLEQAIKHGRNKIMVPAFKPSCPKRNDYDWQVFDLNEPNLKPSKTDFGQGPSIAPSSSLDKFHPKDFKNRMLFDSQRVKRVATKKVLMKRGANY